MTQDEYDEVERILLIKNEKIRDKDLQQFLAIGVSGRELLFRIRHEYERKEELARARHIEMLKPSIRKKLLKDSYTGSEIDRLILWPREEN